MKINIYLLTVALLYSLFFPTNTTAQTKVGLSFHQSTFTKIGVFVDIERWAATEVRILDFVQLKDFSAEFLGFYKLTAREASEIYIGGGYGMSRISELTGPIAAAGANIYPFKNKNFGVHFELNPIFPEVAEPVMRVSWGLRFRFGKEGEESE